MALPYVPPVGLLWLLYGYLMELQWISHGCAMGLPWVSHAVIVLAHGLSMGRRWVSHVQSGENCKGPRCPW